MKLFTTVNGTTHRYLTRYDVAVRKVSVGTNQARTMQNANFPHPPEEDYFFDDDRRRTFDGKNVSSMTVLLTGRDVVGHEVPVLGHCTLV